MKSSQACFFSEKEGERTMGWVEMVSEKVAYHQPKLTSQLKPKNFRDYTPEFIPDCKLSIHIS